MTTKVESDIQSFNLVVEKFAARWDQLKPKDDLFMVKDDWSSATHAITLLQDQRKEFDELVATSSQLMLVKVN